MQILFSEDTAGILLEFKVLWGCTSLHHLKCNGMHSGSVTLVRKSRSKLEAS